MFDAYGQPLIRDWYDDYIEEGEMKIFVISDTHFNHEKIKTYCQRPENFYELIETNWNRLVGPKDIVIHCGDVVLGKKSKIKAILDRLFGRKFLVRGNHDRDKSCSWWMENGFDFACDSFTYRHILFTHEPANAILRPKFQDRPYEVLEAGLPEGVEINIHGHLHNVWDGFIDEKRYERDKELLGIDFKKQLKHPWQRLFAVEYTNYSPVELNKFLAHPEKYQATGPRKDTNGN